MSMWLSEDEGCGRQDRRFQICASPLPAHGGRLGNQRNIGLDLLDASRHRIDLSLESEQVQRESLGRSMEAIRSSLLRIGSSDKLIEQLWTGQ
jgi:hypothetical protein